MHKFQNNIHIPRYCFVEKATLLLDPNTYNFSFGASSRELYYTLHLLYSYYIACVLYLSLYSSLGDTRELAFLSRISID
jgi:hypothetical protein